MHSEGFVNKIQIILKYSLSDNMKDCGPTFEDLPEEEFREIVLQKDN